MASSIFDHLRIMLNGIAGTQHIRCKYPATSETGLVCSQSLNSQWRLCLHREMTRYSGSLAGRSPRTIVSIDGSLECA